jgi:integrase
VWRAACRRADIVGLSFHDLRHEFTSSMLDAGVPIHKVRDWVGHTNIATTSLYANTTLSHLGDARIVFERRLQDQDRNTASSRSTSERVRFATIVPRLRTTPTECWPGTLK